MLFPATVLLCGITEDNGTFTDIYTVRMKANGRIFYTVVKHSLTEN